MVTASTVGREPITLVEIDQDFCSLVYGTAPCTAALGVTGTTKCYQTLASCQDTANFTRSTLTLRFCTQVENTGLPKSVLAIPSLLRVSTVPTRINVGASDPEASPLGQRAKITAEFRDHPYHDRAVDPYWAERDFDPSLRGTFWSKWIARNPFYQGRSMRVLDGYVGQSLAEMKVRHYVIERVDGPSNGIVRVIAKDPIKLLDEVRTRAPSANSGVLVADITAVAGSLALSPAGIGAAEYAASGIGRIGSELVSFTRVNDAVTLTGRGLRESVAATHSAGDAFQEALVVTSERVDELIASLMTTYGGIDPAFIPTDEWDDEATLWCSGFNLSAWITEPTGVQTLIAEILQNTGCYIWWDDEDQEIKFRATRPFFPFTDAAAIELTESANVVADSLNMEFRPEERLSQVWIYYAQTNPAGAVDDAANFARRRILIYPELETPIQYGEQRTKKVFARWLDEANDATTSVVATRILERLRDTPRVIRFDVDAKDSGLRAGKVVRLTHRDIVDNTGEPLPSILQIVAAEAVDVGHRISLEARPYLSRLRYGFIVPNGHPDYSSASVAQRNLGGWIAPSALGFANGDLPYRIL